MEIIATSTGVNEAKTNMEEETTEIAMTMFKTTEPMPQQDTNATMAEAGMPANAENR